MVSSTFTVGAAMTLTKSELAIAALAAAALTVLCVGVGVAVAPHGPDEKVYWLTAAGDAAKLLTFTLAVPAAILALYNHRRGLDQQTKAVAQQAASDLWKRREYVAKATAELEADPSNRFAMSLLDYNARRLKLPGSDVLERFDEDDIVLALAPKAVRGQYKLTETAIRDCFDSLFNALDRLGVMLETGLLTWEDLYPYIGYWLELLEPAPRERSDAFGAAIRLYVENFHFEKLAGLMARAQVPTALDGDEGKLIAGHVGAILKKRRAAAAATARDAPPAHKPDRPPKPKAAGKKPRKPRGDGGAAA
uniref:Uncharacterized protein n=1 Tax=Caulobacter sp. (strain K31) TaxID=366602 RepID=B0T9C4_CAUSK